MLTQYQAFVNLCTACWQMVMVKNKWYVEFHNRSSGVHNNGGLHTKAGWCVHEKQNGTLVVLTGVHNRTFLPHSFSQLLWKLYFGKWLVFIPLWKLFFYSVENGKNGLF